MNTLKTTLFMAALFGLFLLVGRLLGGQQGLVIGFVLALVTNAAGYWFSDKIALAMSGAQPVSPQQAPGLYAMVARLSERAGIPMPRVYVIPSGQPNAFATGRNPQNAAVAVTQGILQMLPQDELEGVVAHELAHIKNRDILISSVAATMGGAISFLAQMLQFRAFFGGLGSHDDEEGGNPIGALAAALLAPLAATVIQLAISRAREFDADRGGAQISGNPMGLANALRRIEYAAEQMPLPVNPAASHLFIINPLGGDRLAGLANLFRTHPRTEERVQRLEEMARAMRASGGAFAGRRW
jgi:Zn-dependent protease with chaperone function